MADSSTPIAKHYIHFGSATMSGYQLKILREAITLVVFVGFEL